MIDMTVLARVCGDPAKLDARLLWCLDIAEVGNTVTIAATSSGYVIRGLSRSAIERVCNASPLSNLQAGVQAARDQLERPAGPFVVQPILSEGVDLVEYRRMFEPGSQAKPSNLSPRPDPAELAVRERGRRLPNIAAPADREPKAD
jgi:hypothetical protein